ncbi:MAG: hypothetical protein KC503_29320 [Myxococcales bacterium]|nr:hypothetical protein [Myxococcales bacterium]
MISSRITAASASSAAAAAALLVLLASDISAAGRGARLRDVYSATLSLGPHAQGRCAASPDGIAARLLLSGVSSERVEALGRAARVGPYAMRFHSELGGRVVGVIDVERGVVRCRVARRRSGQLRLYVGVEPRQDRIHALRRLVRKLPLVKIDSIARGAFKPVEKLIRRHRYERARTKLGQLRLDRQLRYLAELRLADVNVLAGRLPSAHLGYTALARLLHSRPLGLIATLRAAEIAFAVEGRLPTDRAVRLFGRHNRGATVALRDRIGELLLVGGARERALMLALQQPEGHRQLARRALQAAMRRRTWRDDAYGAALLYLRGRKLLGDKLDGAARHRGARLFLALGLPREAADELQHVLRAGGSARLQERLIGDLLRAYRDADESERALQTADYYLSRFGDAAPRHQLALRVRVTQRLRSGDIAGALADLSRLGPHRAPLLTRITRLSLGDRSAARGSSWTIFRQIAERLRGSTRQPARPRTASKRRPSAALDRVAGDSL